MLTDKASIEKGIRFWSVGILGGLLVMLGASLYFIDQEKKEAEARLYETAEYVKVQSSGVTHYNEASESQALLRLIESVRQVGTNLKAEERDRTQYGGGAAAAEYPWAVAFRHSAP